MNLHENRKLFDDIIKEVSDQLKISAGIIEKDYYVTLFLHDLILLDNNFVLKGGTSLSKCYHLINRFSEDIDLNYPIELLTTGKRKKIKNEIIKVIDKNHFHLINSENIRSRRTFNQYQVSYQIEHTDKSLKQLLFIETAFQTESYPTSLCIVKSIIAEFLISKNFNSIINEYDLYPFMINTQSIERTFIDKIFAICDYYLSKKIDEHSRHLYDLYKLYPKVTIDEDFFKLFKKVRKERAKNDYCLSAKPNVHLTSLFESIIANHTFKDDYNNITKELLWEDIEYYDTIEILKNISNILVSNNL